MAREATVTGRRIDGRGAGRVGGRALAAGLAGLVVGSTAVLGAGAAAAAPALPAAPAAPCPRGYQLVATVLGTVCQPLAGAVDAAGGTVGSTTQQAPQVVSGATGTVGGAASGGTAAVGGTVTRATGGTPRTAPRSGGTSSAPKASRTPKPAKAPAKAPTAAGGAAPAPAIAPAAAPPLTAAGAGGLAAATTPRFDALPTAALGSPAAGGLPALGPGAAYDPGLLLAGQPLRTPVPDPVTSVSSAQPMPLLGEDGRVGTPVLLTVLTVAVALALAVRAGVLRRARRLPA